MFSHQAYASRVEVGNFVMKYFQNYTGILPHTLTTYRFYGKSYIIKVSKHSVEFLQLVPTPLILLTRDSDIYRYTSVNALEVTHQKITRFLLKILRYLDFLLFKWYFAIHHSKKEGFFLIRIVFRCWVFCFSSSFYSAS